jgi:(p)ppGpp synthase/HD superfamily hydrolase
MTVWSAEAYARAWHFAATAHRGQTVPGSDLPYIVHVSSVTQEVMRAIAARAATDDAVADPDLALGCALLHDVVEDTDVPLAAIAATFGAAIAAGVDALSKDASLPSKQAQMEASLERIRRQPREVWMVKLADRITNLAPPPGHWSSAKIDAYRDEARSIHHALASACPVLGPRLAVKIAAYPPAT